MTAQRTANPESFDGLLGLEGRGAALYFASLAASLPGDWAFHGRKRHPAPDPVNALLSFGYTLLHHHLASAAVRPAALYRGADLRGGAVPGPRPALPPV